MRFYKGPDTIVQEKGMYVVNASDLTLHTTNTAPTAPPLTVYGISERELPSLVPPGYAMVGYREPKKDEWYVSRWSLKGHPLVQKAPCNFIEGNQRLVLRPLRRRVLSRRAKYEYLP